MKKIVLLLIVLLLSACQNNANQSVDSMFEKKQSEPVPNVDPNVQVYSTFGNAAGYVIHVDEREKWIVTIGSVVRAHPKALVVLGNEQQLEGEVRYLDEKNNIALISIKSSAIIEPYVLANDAITDLSEIGHIIVANNTLQSLTSFTMKEGEMHAIPVTATTIKQALDGVDKLTMKDRQAFYHATKEYPEFAMFDMKPFDQYEKDTFAYNPDQIELFSYDFLTSMNAFIDNGNSEELDKYIANDNLKDMLKENHTVSNNGTFTSLKTKDIFYTNFQFVVEMEAQYVTPDKQEEVTIILNLIEMDKKYKVINMKLKEK